MQRYIIVILFGLVPFLNYSQDIVFDDGRTIFTSEMAGGAFIHSGGWGVNFRYGQYKGAFKKLVYEGELTGMRHPKEIKTYNPVLDNNLRGYYYGKRNSLTLLRGSVGYHKSIYSKQNSKGVEVNYLLHGGLTLGFLKPVYLTIGTPGRSDSYKEEKYDPEKHNTGNIIERAPWYYGMDGIKLLPAGYAKFGLNFEYATESKNIKALEVGTMFDVFPRPVEIMADTRNRQVYFSLYLNLLIGSKKSYGQ